MKTLFVRLTYLSTTIQLEGLPLNVVPITPTTKKTKCKMPNGLVTLTQVCIVPNFAMTNFASLSRTYINNVVDLH